MGGASQTPDWRSRRGEEGVCPAHSSPGSLLGSQVRYPALQDQGWRTRLGPFCSLSLSPTPQAPRAFSSPVGPEHWPHPPPKPHPCLGPALYSQGLSHPPFFFLFSLLLFFTIVVLMYLLVVDSSIFYFYIPSNISVSFLV